MKAGASLALIKDLNFLTIGVSANTLLRVVSICYCPIPCKLEAAPSQFESTIGRVLKIDMGLIVADPMIKMIRDGLLAMCIVSVQV